MLKFPDTLVSPLFEILLHLFSVPQLEPRHPLSGPSATRTTLKPLPSTETTTSRIRVEPSGTRGGSGSLPPSCMCTRNAWVLATRSGHLLYCVERLRQLQVNLYWHLQHLQQSTCSSLLHRDWIDWNKKKYMIRRGVGLEPARA